MIYLIEQSDKYKIGYTNDILRLISQYETHNYDFKLLYIIRGDKQLESELHKRFSNLKVRSEWFNIDDSILEYFRDNGMYVGYNSTDKDDNNMEDNPALDEPSWFKLYSGVFCSILSDIKSLIDVKVFAVCLLASIQDDKYGNVVETGNRFKNILSKYVTISQPALSRSLKNLTEAGMLNRIATSYYQIHPQVAYCGNRHDRAKLILQLVKE